MMKIYNYQRSIIDNPDWVLARNAIGPRLTKVCLLIEEGYNLRELADYFDVSRERARQLALKAGRKIRTAESRAELAGKRARREAEETIRRTLQVLRDES